MKNDLFRIMGPIRADLSGLPYGFLFMWKPRDDAEGGKYSEVVCVFSIGCRWSCPSQWSFEEPLKWWRMPSFSFARGRPAS